MADLKHTMTLKEFVEKHPEYIANKKKKKTNKSKMRYMCQCKCGHVFDYRKRKRLPDDDKYYAPCQGRCPRCDSTEFSFLGNDVNIYPIKWNFL